jgi:hypothetical protein
MTDNMRGGEDPKTLRKRLFRSFWKFSRWVRSRSLREWQYVLFEIVLFVFFVVFLIQFAIFHLFG